MPVQISEYLHDRGDYCPTIYAYSKKVYPGYLKVGMTTKRDVEERIIQTLAQQPKEHTTELVESRIADDGSVFTDKQVHKLLEEMGCKQREDAEEYYECTVDQVRAAIIALRHGKPLDKNRTRDFKMRAEQQEAVKVTAEYFEREAAKGSPEPPKFLWNAKM